MRHRIIALVWTLALALLFAAPVLAGIGTSP